MAPSAALIGEELRALEQLFRSTEAKVVLAYKAVKCSHSTSERGSRKAPAVAHTALSSRTRLLSSICWLQGRSAPAGDGKAQSHMPHSRAPSRGLRVQGHAALLQVQPGAPAGAHDNLACSAPQTSSVTSTSRNVEGRWWRHPAYCHCHCQCIHLCGELLGRHMHTAPGVSGWRHSAVPEIAQTVQVSQSWKTRQITQVEVFPTGNTSLAPAVEITAPGGPRGSDGRLAFHIAGPPADLDVFMGMLVMFHR